VGWVDGRLPKTLGEQGLLIKPLILVVDDQATNLLLLDELLADPYRVLPARSGAEALCLAASELPDLILLDVMMPDQDGYAVCRQLKAQASTADIPVIFVTARGEVMDEQQGLELGAVDYITKPYSQEILLARIHTHLRLRSLTQELERQVQARTLELRQTLAEADVASRTKTQFLANMNHELRTPLNAILGAANLLQQSPLNAQQQGLVETAQLAAQNLLQRVEDILRIARSDDASLQPRPAPFALQDCLRLAIRPHSQAAARKGIRLRIEAAADMPEGVQADASLIAHSLGYLLDNAIKFSPEGSEVLLRHELIPGEQGLIWQLHLIDQGIGMPLEVQDQLFEAFRQADGSSQRAFNGMGLGLTLARKLVRLLGGDIGLSSQPGVGSDFCLRLPVRRLSNPLVLSPEPLTEAVKPEAEAQEVRLEPDREGLHRILMQLRQALAAYDTEALELAGQCARLLDGSPQAELAKPLIQALSDYDFDKAEAALEQLGQALTMDSG
jgi:signal transduction histidine kinase